MKKITSLFLLMLSTVLVFELQAQNVEFTKKNFPKKKAKLKEALKNIMMGDELFYMGRGRYEEALTYYMKAQKFNPNNKDLNFKIGRCLVYSPDKELALSYLKRAVELDPDNVDPEIIFYTARAYHLMHKFDEAIEKYREYKSKLTPNELVQKAKEIDRYIFECQNGKEFIKNPTRVIITNLGPNINTPFPEYSPVINADETVLSFTSRRPNTTGEKRDPRDQKFFEDIYIAYKDKDNTWKKPTQPEKPLNTTSHDATVGLSHDGQTLIIYRGNVGGGDLFMCTLKGKKWGKPKRLNKNINTKKFHESSATLSPDGQKLFFVSDRPGGFGGHDIYVSELTKKGDWGPAKLLPGIINTEYDEEAIFMQADGKTLYFSSKGHNSMGGYDIFKTTFEKGVWSKPENLGYPVNSADDDVFLSISASGRNGYYSSLKAGGYGDQDIYMITFLGPEKPMYNYTEDNLIAWRKQPIQDIVIEQAIEIKSASLTLFKGRTLDAVTQNPVEATIVISDIDKNEQIATFKSNAETGKFLVSLPGGKNYGIAVNAEGYLFHSENFNIPESATYQEVEKDIFLNKIAVGSSIVLKNIFFDFDKATLRPESINELDRLVKLLNDIPTMKIEISGHTDNIGSAAYNKDLSERRAKAVVDYLVKKGIKPERLTYKGYGFEKPIAPNDTDEGRQLNRRTEFKIIGN